MQDLVGKRVRCLPTGKIYRAVAQAGGEIVGHDEETGERVVLPVSRVVQHSPFLICVGAVIQTVVLADYAPLGESAHLIRSGFLGSFALATLAWMLGMSAPVLLSAYLVGGLIGVAISATRRYRLRVRRMKSAPDATSKSRARKAKRRACVAFCAFAGLVAAERPAAADAQFLQGDFSHEESVNWSSVRSSRGRLTYPN